MNELIKNIKSLEEKEEHLEERYLDVKLKIEKKINKQGVPYKILSLFYERPKSGELIKFHEVYMKEHLEQIINLFFSLEKE